MARSEPYETDSETAPAALSDRLRSNFIFERTGPIPEPVSRLCWLRSPPSPRALLELMDDYARRDSALEIVELKGHYSLQLRESFQDVMLELVPAELGLGAQRTLAAIAIKQPLLQSDLVELRGSGAYQQVKDLVELGLVRRRKSADGRSYELRLTDKFHQYFQLQGTVQSLDWIAKG